MTAQTLRAAMTSTGGRSCRLSASMPWKGRCQIWFNIVLIGLFALSTARKLGGL